MPRNEDGLNQISWLMHEIQSSFIPGYFRKLGCIFTLKTNSIRFIEIIQNALLLIAHNQDFCTTNDHRNAVSPFKFLKNYVYAIKSRFKDIIFDP